MAELFRASANWSGTSQSNGQPSVWFTAETTGHFWQIEARRTATRAEFYFYHNGAFISGVFFQFAADQAPYDAGGALAVEKEEALDAVRWITPLGTETRTLSGFGALNSNPLRPYSVRLDLDRILPLTQDSQATARWSEFLGRRDGQLFIGARMSAADPGIWSPVVASPFGLPANGAIPADNAQETATYRLRLVYTNAADNPKSPGTSEERVWAGGDNITYAPGVGIDAAICPISGFLYTIRKPVGAPETIAFGRSTDGGHTITETIIHAAVDDKEQFGLPSIAVDAAGLIVATWVSALLNGSFAVIAVRRTTRQSEDLGATWAAAIHVALGAGLALTTDAARFHPHSGHLLESYQTDVDLLGIVYDGYKPTGFTRAAPWATPRTIRAWIGGIRQAIAPTAAGEWLLTWLDGPRTVLRSEDHGYTWTTTLTSLVSDTGQATLAYGAAAGLHYLVQQDKLGGDLRSSASDDEAVGVLTALSDKLAVAGAAQQFAALVVDHAGLLLLVYLVFIGPDYSPRCRVSEDHGITWRDA